MLDALAPSGGFATRAVHEVLSETDLPSLVLPLLVARQAACDQRVEVLLNVVVRTEGYISHLAWDGLCSARHAQTTQ